MTGSEIDDSPELPLLDLVPFSGPAPESGELNVPAHIVDGLPCPEVILSGPNVAAMADLVTMVADLELVAEICNDTAARLTGPSLSADRETTLLRIGWEAATVAYGRAFVNGAAAGPDRGTRMRVPEGVLEALTADEKELHRKVIWKRNKVVAHRVDDTTQVRVTATLNPEGEGRDRGVIRLRHVYVGSVSAAADLEQLGALANRLRDLLHVLMRKAAHVVSDEVRAVPLDELYELARKQRDG